MTTETLQTVFDYIEAALTALYLDPELAAETKAVAPLVTAKDRIAKAKAKEAR